MNTTNETICRILDTDSYDRVLIDVQGTLYWTEKGSEGAVRLILSTNNDAATILDRLEDASIEFEVDEDAD
jgi:hypothetical protein